MMRPLSKLADASCEASVLSLSRVVGDKQAEPYQARIMFSLREAIQRSRSGAVLAPTRMRIRQSAYLNNRIEQDHRAIKGRVRPMLGFQTIDSARAILSGIEMAHMMRKWQAKYARNPQPSLAEQFHLLAA